MRVGIVGLGKLGLPVAAAMASRGVEVFGHDIRPEAMRLPEDTIHEDGLAEAIDAGKRNLHFVGLTELIIESEVVFVAVQTPHEPEFEGVTPLGSDRSDFDYSALKRAVSEIVRVVDELQQPLTLAVISTVLPGTMEREIAPLLGEADRLVYNPSFIAMGTTIRDFLDPEFVLLGGDDGTVEDAYRAIWGIDRPRHVRVSIRDAELIKVAYNTFIGLKIAFANTLMEVCHKTGCDVDNVTGALKLANRRLISGAYLDGGMGDGGGCHPRDNIALSWLARKLDLSYDLFGAAMECREAQAEWLADTMLRFALERKLPLGILGLAYKPESHITTGSPALLVRNLLEQAGHPVTAYDARAGVKGNWRGAKVWLIGCKHSEYEQAEFAPGSVVIDPWRYIPDQLGIEVIRVGEGVRPAADDGQAGDGRAVRPLAA